jgi:putative membrane protein
VSAPRAASAIRVAAAHTRYLRTLSVLFGLEWTALAVSPRHRQDWALENALSVAFVTALALSYRRLVLSRMSYTAIFLFLSLHTTGAHYTYSEVPYDAWARVLTGHAVNDLFGWQRNHFDRFAHFAYGMLLAYPIRELLVRVARVRGLWAYYLPLAVTTSTSAAYEFVEWGAALVFGGDLGIAFLGTQGDVWDTQKDMALAAAGAIVSLTTLAMASGWRRCDVARQRRESRRVRPA